MKYRFSMPHEVDPLLPKDAPSPEVHGSRPQSIRDTGLSGEDKQYDEVKAPRGRPSTRRSFSIMLICFLVVAFCFFSAAPERGLPSGHPHSKPKTLEERVDAILTDTPLIDGHNDLAILIRFLYNNHIYSEDFTTLFEKGGMPAQVDLPRLKAGKSGGAFWAAYVPCPKNGTDYSDENYATSVEFTYSQLDLLGRLFANYPDTFSPPPTSAKQALSFFHKHQLISPLIIEGLHQIGNKMSNLRNFAALGVKYATLTHNCHNLYADAALVEVSGGVKIAEPLHNGVSELGREVIREMNRLGMIVDLSHVSAATMRDVLGGSEKSKGWAGSVAPPIFSHSSAYAVCPHPRNVPDDILQLVKKRNAVVMVNFSPDFVSCRANPDGGMPIFVPENSTMERVADHIMHIGGLIGFEHVGLGSDFDGIPSTPKDLEDVSKYPALVKELLKRGVSDEQAKGVVGGNVLRVWAEVDAVRDHMRKDGVKPLEDDLPPLRMGRAAMVRGGPDWLFE